MLPSISTKWKLHGVSETTASISFYTYSDPTFILTYFSRNARESEKAKRKSFVKEEMRYDPKAYSSFLCGHRIFLLMT